MSRVLGCVPKIRRWEYMATAMARDLDSIVTGESSPKDLHSGVLRDAEYFLDSAAQIAEQNLSGSTPVDPPANIANFSFAQQAMPDCPAFDTELLALRDFVKHLSGPDACWGDYDELKQSASKAAGFFRRLAALADSC